MYIKKKKSSLMDLGRQMQEIVDRAFRQAMFSSPGEGADYLPGMDLAETGDAMLVVLEIPGVAKEDVEVSVESDLLRITGKRREFLPPDVSRYHHVEIDRGDFERVIQIPPGFQLDAAEASLQEGLLYVRLPKEEREAPKVIEVTQDEEEDGAE
jgi:HSP20 family protein